MECWLGGGSRWVGNEVYSGTQQMTKRRIPTDAATTIWLMIRRWRCCYDRRRRRTTRYLSNFFSVECGCQVDIAGNGRGGGDIIVVTVCAQERSLDLCACYLQRARASSLCERVKVIYIYSVYTHNCATVILEI